MKGRWTFVSALVALCLLALVPGAGQAQGTGAQESPPIEVAPSTTSAMVGTAFTYQGEVVKDGSPVTDSCDFQFSLWDAAGAGTQVGATQTKAGVVVSHGLFTIADLNFGYGAFTGDARWLAIAVRCPAGSGTYTALSPRQALTAVPYALGLRPGATVAGAVALPGTALAVLNSSNGIGITGHSAVGTGVYGSSAGSAGSSYGVYGRHTGSGNHGLLGTSTTGVSGHGTDIGVYGTSGSGHGVFGVADSGDGVRGFTQASNKSGVYGYNSNVDGFGVYGRNTASSNLGYLGGGTTGVHGEAFGGTNSGITGVARGGQGSAVMAEALGSDAHGVFAIALGIRGTGIYAEGGTEGYAAVFRGNVRVTSKTTAATIIELGEGLDFAEGFAVSDVSQATPGAVVSIDPLHPGHLTLSSIAYDRRVAGIVAGANGLGSGVRLGVDQFDVDVALAGRVYCNVDATYGAVAPGDLLTTSPTPGYAMVVKDAVHAQGAVLGKAMEGLPAGEQGQILVLVSLQ